MQAFRYPSTMACVRKTYAEEGIAGFYRGVLPVLLTASILRSTSFLIYFRVKSDLLTHSPLALEIPAAAAAAAAKKGARPTDDTSTIAMADMPKLTAAAFLAGAISGSMVQRQLERLAAAHAAKQAAGGANMVAAAQAQTKTTLEWMRFILRTKGLAGLYTGCHIQIVRDFLGTGCYFAIYETFKRAMTPEGGQPGPLVHMFGGGIAGTLSWLVLFPVDVVKSVIQRDAFTGQAPRYRGGWDFARRRLASRGVAGFYEAIWPQLVRSFPIHSLNFLVYEFVLARCRSAGTE
ncbi:hypothetical protein HK105_201613 [Polyrhizophydium stewartii]|uniref:Mitochondrial carrier protein n=1 Tax=Polyrhizophydium stewartii TaxID=2732419 RepID=A0ABR4NH53_9FUNG